MTLTAVDALNLGVAYLVDEDGHRLTGTAHEQLLMGHCWAHLLDATTGQWHVHPLRQAAELATPGILEMLTPLPSPTQSA